MSDEQNATTEPTEPAAPAEVTRADLIAAATGEGVPDVPEDKPAEPAAEEEPRYARLLREREKGQAEREAARNEAAELRAQAQAEREKMLAEAREEAKRLAREEVEAQRRRFRENPSEALRELGDPNDVADRIIKANTPEGREMLRIRDELEATKREANEAKSVKEELEKFRADQKKEADDRARAAVYSQFMGQYATPEKTPYLHARWEPDEIFHKSNELAISWRNKGLEPAKDFTLDDVAQYLEKQSRDRVSGILGNSAPAQQVRAGAVATPPGNAPKVSANGSRTPAMAGGERRATPKPLSEMTPAQQRAALLEEAEAAMKAHSGSK